MWFALLYTDEFQYQPKMWKMADFETFTFCISLNSSQMCNFFTSYWVLSVCGKTSDS